MLNLRAILTLHHRTLLLGSLLAMSEHMEESFRIFASLFLELLRCAIVEDDVGRPPVFYAGCVNIHRPSPIALYILDKGSDRRPSSQPDRLMGRFKKRLPALPLLRVFCNWLRWNVASAWGRGEELVVMPIPCHGKAFRFRGKFPSCSIERLTKIH